MGILIFLGIGILTAIGTLYTISLTDFLDQSDPIEWLLCTILSIALGMVWPLTITGFCIFAFVKYVLIRK